VRATDGRAIGSTSLFNFRALDESPPYAAEIGFTWLAASAQRTGTNIETKLLLLAVGFDQWGLARVDLKTDARNERSRRAIEGIGARFEGVLRNSGPSWAPGEQGKLRDSAMFSIVADEWPDVRSRLRERLSGESQPTA
jgi:RimJ/RimL family protein N-acetyltransferase